MNTRGFARLHPFALLALSVAAFAAADYAVRLHLHRREARGADVRFSADEHTPPGIVSGVQALHWTFAAPPSRRAAASAVVLRPAVKGEWDWIAGDTLQFMPVEPWPAATEFVAEVNDGSAGTAGARGGRLFTFATPPLTFRTAEVRTADAARRVQLYLQFSADADPASLRKSLKLEDGEGRKVEFEVGVRLADGGVIIRTEPVQHTQLKVAVAAGLAPLSGGTLTLAEPVTRTLTVPDRFRFVRLEAEGASFGGGTIQARFTREVAVEGAAAFIAVDPAVPFTVAPWSSWRGGGCVLNGEFEPGRVYTVTFKPGLADGNGETLDEEITRRVQIPERPASIAFNANGRYLSPRSPLRLGLAAVNVPEYTVAVAPVLPQNLVQYALREAGLVPNTYGYDEASYAGRLTGPVTLRTNRVAMTHNQPVDVVLHLREFTDEDPHGAYLVSIRRPGGRVIHRLLAVTDLAISARRAPDGVLVWVTSLRDGRPAEGAEAVLHAMNNTELARARTDASGLAWLALPSPTPGDEQAPFLVSVRAGADLTFLPLVDATAVSELASDGQRTYAGAAGDAFVFLDRGIYRPGERAHVRLLVRDAALGTPAPFPVVVRVSVPGGRLLREQQVMLDAAGTAGLDVDLPDFTPTGRYSVDVAVPGGDTSLGHAGFAVEDFVPPQTVAEIRNLPPLARGGETLRPRVEARHLFGRAASGLAVSATVEYRSAPFAPEGWKEYQFGDADKPAFLSRASLGKAVLDDDGRATFEALPLAAWRPPAALTAVIETTVVETSGRTVSAFASCPVHLYPFYVGLRRDWAGSVVAADHAQSVAVALVTPEGAGTNAVATVQAALSRVSWTSWLRRQPDGRYVYESKRVLEPVSREEIPLRDGRGAAPVRVDRAGDYLLTVSAAGDAGVSSSLTFAATTPDQQWVDRSQERPGRVELTFDRERYRPGETARLTLRAPFSGLALLTVETDRIHEQRVITLERNEATVEVPVRAAYLPNAHCAVTVLRPVEEAAVWSAHRAAGRAILSVAAPEREMKVALTAPDEVRPLTRLRLEARLTDPEGRPRPGALASFAAVDEGILMLTWYKTPDPLAFFLAARRSPIEAYDPFGLLVPILSEAGGGAGVHVAGDGGGDGLRRRLNPIRARRFVPVALWRAEVRADTNGVAVAEFDVPEFSGELRLMAVACDPDRMGAAARAVKVRRPVIVQTSLPRFLAPGDRAQATLAVFNESGREAQVKVHIACTGPVRADVTERILTLPAGARRQEPVQVEAGPVAGVAVVEVTVDPGDGAAWTERIELAVRPAAPLTAEYRVGKLAPGREVVLEAPPGWVRESVWSEVWAGDLSCELAAGMGELMRYPYGCLEQTTSRLFPMLYLPELAAAVQSKAVDRPNVGDVIREAVDRLCAMQVWSGGFAPWAGGTQADEWNSIYATWALVETKRAGHAVPQERLDAALDHLRERLSDILPSDGELAPEKREWQDAVTELAFACHVLAAAGRPEFNWNERLRELAPHLRPAARAHLALALAHGGRPRDAAGLLEGGVAAPAEREPDGCLNSRVRDDALRLLGWLDLDPHAPAAAVQVRRLLEARRGGRWETTQENAMALLALGRFVKLQPPPQGRQAGQLAVPGGAAPVRFEAKPLKWSAPAPGLTEGLKLRNDGETDLYYTVRFEGVPARGAVPEADRGGVRVRRTFLKADGTGVADPNGFRVGDLYVVRVEVAGDLRHVAVEDLLPAGLEIENPNLSTSAILSWIGAQRTGWYQSVDLRDDRLLFFTGAIGSGTWTYYYGVRAVTPGRFALPPVSASAMYDPSAGSVHGAGVIEVKAPAEAQGAH